ncbi:MAG: hypothetical protein E7318_02125 [Clostridiales bacterium]|nr:hypothetical protein [Clostridiales bacterium]
MKKMLTLTSIILLIAAATTFLWPRLSVPVDTEITLFSYDSDSQTVTHILNAEDAAIIHSMLDGKPILPNWLCSLLGQRFHFSAEFESGLLLIQSGINAKILRLPKLGSPHLLQLNMEGGLIWLTASELDMLEDCFERNGIYFPGMLN